MRRRGVARLNLILDATESLLAERGAGEDEPPAQRGAGEEPDERCEGGRVDHERDERRRETSGDPDPSRRALPAEELEDRLAPDLGLTPEESRIEIDWWKEGVASGEITEVFACGTAAVVTPVGELRWAGGSAPSTGGEGGGEITRTIRQSLLDIQYGVAEDTRGWMTRLA